MKMIPFNWLAVFLIIPLAAQKPGEWDDTRLLGSVADGTAPPEIQKPAPPVLRVESSRTLRLGDRKLTIRRVVPPVLERRLAPASEGPVNPAQEQPATESTFTELLHISATVHRNTLSQVRGWTEDGNEFRAWTDIDFNNFSGFSSFVHKGRQYGLIMGIGNEDSFPADAKFPPARDSFLMEKQSGKNPQAREIAEAFTALFKSEKETLVSARLGREAAARNAAVKPPALPTEITLSIWDKPSRSLTPAEKALRDEKKEATR